MEKVASGGLPNVDPGNVPGRPILTQPPYTVSKTRQINQTKQGKNQDEPKDICRAPADILEQLVSLPLQLSGHDLGWRQLLEWLPAAWYM